MPLTPDLPGDPVPMCPAEGWILAAATLFHCHDGEQGSSWALFWTEGEISTRGVVI